MGWQFATQRAVVWVVGEGNLQTSTTDWFSRLANAFLHLYQVKKFYAEKSPEYLQFLNDLTLASLW